MKKLTILIGALAALAAPAIAAADPIAARQALMRNNAAASGLAGAVANGDIEYHPVVGRAVIAALRGGSVCLNTVLGVPKWIGGSFQAAAGIGVARLMYARSGVFPPSEECGLLPL